MKRAPVDKKRWLFAWLLPWLICVVLANLMALFVQKQTLLFPIDAKFYDIGLTRRPVRVPDNITVIGLSDAFVGKRHVSQIPRDKLARLIEVLAAAKPAVIGVDVWLDSSIEDGARRGDEKLRAALVGAKKAGVPVVLAQLETEQAADVNDGENTGKGTTAHGSTIPFFAEVATVGGVSYTPDADKVVRFLPDETATLPSMPFLLARHSVKKEEQTKLDALRQQLITLPRPLDFSAPPGRGEHHIQLNDAQNLLDQPFLANLLAPGKIVLIGATFPRSTDLFQSPYNNIGVRTKFYGVEILANSTFTLREGAPRLSHESLAAQNKVLLLAVFVAALVAVAALWHLWAGVLVFLLSSGGALWLATASASGDAARWPMYWPPSPLLTASLGAWILAAGWRQKVIGNELKMVRDTFGGYVGDEVLQQLGGRLPEMGGETRNVAVLFCDIQGFSGLAEGLRDDPARLLGLLNEHFSPLVEALQQRGAYVDNYVGDLVMAVFGAPITKGYKADVNAAVLSALDFERIITERNVQRKARGELPIEVGVGVHCGSAVVGNLGSRRKMHYTAIGDTVNIASRVESETRHYPTRLLVTEDVTAQCPDYNWQFVAETAVKGRAAPVKLYCVKQ